MGLGDTDCRRFWFVAKKWLVQWSQNWVKHGLKVIDCNFWGLDTEPRHEKKSCLFQLQCFYLEIGNPLGLLSWLPGRWLQGPWERLSVFDSPSWNGHEWHRPGIPKFLAGFAWKLGDAASSLYTKLSLSRSAERAIPTVTVPCLGPGYIQE